MAKDEENSCVREKCDGKTQSCTCVLIPCGYNRIQKLWWCVDDGTDPEASYSYTCSFKSYKLVCIWAPSTKREVCPRLLRSLSKRTLNTKYSLHLNQTLVHKSKHPTFLLLQTSNTQRAKALHWYQRRDQLSQGCEKGVWTADEVKCPYAGQLGSECSPEMQWWTEKYLALKER